MDGDGNKVAAGLRNALAAAERERDRAVRQRDEFERKVQGLTLERDRLLAVSSFLLEGWENAIAENRRVGNVLDAAAEELAERERGEEASPFGEDGIRIATP